MRLVWLAPLMAIGLTGCVVAGPASPTAGPATADPTDFNALTQDGDDVETVELPPPDAPIFGPAPPPDLLAAPDELGQPDQIAVLAESSGAEVAFQDLPGGWTISIDGGACPLSLTETPWEGGFRASTRSCQSDVLAALSSWRLEGQEVVLYAEGAIVARLYATSIFRDGNGVANARFEGQLVQGGIPVIFFR